MSELEQLRAQIRTLNHTNVQLVAQCASADEAVAVLWEEMKRWRNFAEDSHDENYGFCRPGCSKCAAKKLAWEQEAITTASPDVAAALNRIAQSRSLGAMGEEKGTNQ